MNRLLLFSIAFLLVLKVAAQVSISTDGSAPAPSAGLEVRFTDKGLLPPRLNTLQRNNILSPARGLVIFNTDCNDLQTFNGTTWIPIGNTGFPDTPGSITGSTVPCAGSLSVPYSIAPVPGATGYAWTVPAGAAITGGQGTPAITVSFGLASGIVCVSCLTSCSKSAVRCIPVSVGMVSPVSATVTATDDTVCAGTPVTYTVITVNGGTYPSYQWELNGTGVAGATNSSYTFAPSDHDTIRCTVTSSLPCASNNPASSAPFVMNVMPVLPVSVSIAASVNPACAGTQVTFSAAAVNGGNLPAFQWKVNGTNAINATNATYAFIPANGDAVTCEMTSGESCTSGNPALSGAVVMSVLPIPASPVPAGHIVAQTQVTWRWRTVAGATGYKWNTVNNFASALDLGTDTTEVETGLACNSAYSRYAWAYSGCGPSAAVTLTQVTSPCTYPCSPSVIKVHVAGSVAPVNKTVTYGGVTGVTGEPTKCWITSNLGADHQATSVNDATEASAGWYWQFNRKQGYRHDGSAPFPAWTITGIFENSDWISDQDPCTLELGAMWRIPSYSEWFNVDAQGGWTDWISAWNSPLKLHASGCLGWTAGALFSRGSSGYFWSNTRESNSNGHGMTIYSGGSYVNPYNKAYGFPLRCLHD